MDELAVLRVLDVRGTVEAAIDAMADDRRAEVLRTRLGLDGSPSATLDDIGKRLGVTRERVRQLEQKAIAEMVRLVPSVPGGTVVNAAVRAFVRPGEDGADARAVDAVRALRLPWSPAVAAKVVIALAGRKRSSRPAARTTPDEGPSLYDVVTAQFGGVVVTGQHKRFERTGWFAVDPVVVGCPECGGSVHPFRRPYLDSNGKAFRHWALVCLACRKAWAPSDLSPENRRLL